MNLRENTRYFDDFTQRRAAERVVSRHDETAAPDGEPAAGADLNEYPKNEAAEKLPSLATSNDVREVVRVLKDKPAGLPMLEVLKFEPRRVFEARKLAAYEFWGVISRDGNRIALTPLGRQMAEMIVAESRLFARLLSRIAPYLEAVEWIGGRQLKTVTHDDVTEFWNRSNGAAVALREARNSEAEAVSFFSICHAAELGVATVGKRGQPARLRIEVEKVEEFLFEIKNAETPNPSPTVFDRVQNPVGGNGNRPETQAAIRRVYVSGAPGGGVLKHLCGSLELADFEGVVSSDFFENDFPRQANLEILRSCQAGVFVVGEEECRTNSAGRTRIESEHLTEMAAALALFDGRVIVIWNSPLAPPEEFRQYGSPVLTGDDEIAASFRTVKLLKAMQPPGANRR